MEYVTILVRWRCPPLPHTGFITDGVQKWLVCRWKSIRFATRLTVICFQIARNRSEMFTRQTLSIIRNMWAVRTNTRLTLVPHDVLLSSENEFAGAQSNLYKIFREATSPETTFFTYVNQKMSWVKKHGWYMKVDLTNGDDETTFKLGCRHYPHNVGVIPPGSNGNVMIVRCNEPQTLYDLLKRHNLTCSSVWDDTVALSARAPCTAVIDHNMITVRVNEIPWNDRFRETTEVSTYYHDMAYIRAEAEPGSLRHRSLPGPHVAENGAEEVLIPVALYYNDPTDEVIDVIKADGRFIPSARYEVPDGADGKLIKHLHRRGCHITAGPPSSEGEAETPPALACFACQATADGILDCGHLCCGVCLRRLERGDGDGVMCGMCRNPSTEFKRIEIPQHFTYSCGMCCQKKNWLTNCAHLTCTCYTKRCPACHKTINILQKVFVS